MKPIDAASAFIEERFPECSAAFVGGSVIRGEGTATSDLDIVVITERPEAPYRESVREFGWPIEAFVHTQESLRHYFKKDVDARRPALPRMCREGIVLRDSDGLAQRIQEEANDLIERGPEALTASDIEQRRYAVTDLLDDFVGCANLEEGVFIANDLAVAATDLLLLRHRQWIGRGKWVPRRLKHLDPKLADQLVNALRAYYQSEAKGDLIRFAEQTLDLVGGRLFEGYYSPAESQ